MIVLDASTLILVARIDLLDAFLAGVSSRVVVPQEVMKECCRSKKTLHAFMIQRKFDESKIQVLVVKNKRLVIKLQSDFGLGQGEAEAIALALEQKAQLVGVDDKNGMNACKLLGIPFVTAAGILLRSRQKNLISKDAALAKLSQLAVYGRYKNSIIEDMRARLEAPV